MGGRELQHAVGDVLVKLHENGLALGVCHVGARDVRQLAVAETPSNLVAGGSRDRERNGRVYEAAQRRHGLVALHLRAAGILHLANLLHERARAQNHAHALGAQHLEARERGEVGAKLVANGFDLGSGVVVVGYDVDVAQYGADSLDDLAKLVGIIRLLARVLNKNTRYFTSMLGADVGDGLVVVEVGHDRMDTHRVEGDLGGRVDRRVVYEHRGARVNRGHERPTEGTGPGSANEHGILGIKGVGEHVLHANGLERPVGALVHAQVSQVKRLLARKVVGRRVDDLELQLPCLLERPRVQRIGLHLEAPSMSKMRAGLSTSMVWIELSSTPCSRMSGRMWSMTSA